MLENPGDSLDEDTYYKNDNANVLSSLTYWWLNWLPILGYKRLLTTEDLGVLPKKHNAKRIHDVFKVAYEQEKVWCISNRGRRVQSHYPTPTQKQGKNEKNDKMY